VTIYKFAEKGWRLDTADNPSTTYTGFAVKYNYAWGKGHR